MFWNKKNTEVKTIPTPTAAANNAVQQEIKKPKEKKLSPKDIVMGQIEMLEPGHSLSYITKTWSGTDLMVVEANADYPGKGHKYLVSYEEIVDDKPSGKRQHIGDSDKVKQVTEWILSRKGELYNPQSS